MNSLNKARKIQVTSTWLLQRYISNDAASNNVTASEDPFVAFEGESDDTGVLAVDKEGRNEDTALSYEDGFRSDRDIPFLLLPQTVKKAYHVHETQLRLPRVLNKYKWLSKTITTPSLPAHYSQPMENEGLYNELLKDYHDSLFTTVAYTKEHRSDEGKVRFVPERINHCMLTNILRLTMSGDDAAHLQPGNSYLYHNPFVETYWCRNSYFYRSSFRPNFVLRTKNGFDVLETPKSMSASDVERIPGPYNSYELNMYRQGIVHLRNRPAMDNYKVNPIKHCHTTVMHNNRMKTDEQFLSLGVMTMFVQLASQAQADGVLHGTELKKPLVTQCIVTNGHRIAFMVYQLNTLHMLDDKGVWNRCWHSPVEDMFTLRPHKGDYLVFESTETGEELNGFNKECFLQFMNFIKNKTV